MPLLETMYPSLRIEKGPLTPPGIVARKLEDGSVIYVNTVGTEQSLNLDKPATGVLSGKRFESSLTLAAYDAEVMF